jgi:DNA ligase-1
VTQPESAAKATKSPEEDEDADMKVEEEDQDTGADARAQDVDKAEEFDTASDGGDELAEIDGIKPAVYMKDGEEREVGSLTR